jgi:hypothetical protein
VLDISVSFPTQYGSFRLITNFTEKSSKNTNNTLQNSGFSEQISHTDCTNNSSEEDTNVEPISLDEGEVIPKIDEEEAHTNEENEDAFPQQEA